MYEKLWPVMNEELRNWLALRKEAAKHIDGATAEVDWNYDLVLDPYGIDPELPEEYRLTDECRCVGRNYFARAPGSDVWVSFDDLPDVTREALWRKHSNKFAFPTGLEEAVAASNRHLVEVPDTFAIARWPRDADVATIARCILGTLKYEPHTADTTALRRALESVDHAQRASSTAA
jgi:hypothetical protein